MPDFTWRPHGNDAERMVMIGSTGSGKTTLARSLVANADRVVWWDTKAMGESGFEQRVTWAPEHAELIAATDRLEVAPDPHRDHTEQMDEVAHAVYQRGNILFVVDDAMGVMAQRAPQWTNNVVTMGRSRGVGLLTIVQRVHHIPRVLMTEAEHTLAFELHGRTDIERLVDECSPDLAVVAELQRFEYVWYSRRDRLAVKVPPLKIA